jgi:hypothetical protein
MATKRTRKPKRVLVYVSFEVERDTLPPHDELRAAFNGALDGVLKVGECYYAGKLGTKFVRHAS